MQLTGEPRLLLDMMLVDAQVDLSTGRDPRNVVLPETQLHGLVWLGLGFVCRCGRKEGEFQSGFTRGRSGRLWFG